MSETDMANYTPHPLESRKVEITTPPTTMASPDSTESETPNSIEKKPKASKRKRKQSYQSMMAAITRATKTDQEIKDDHQKKIKESLGGGQFKKLDKII